MKDESKYNEKAEDMYYTATSSSYEDNFVRFIHKHTYTMSLRLAHLFLVVFLCTLSVVASLASHGNIGFGWAVIALLILTFSNEL